MSKSEIRMYKVPLCELCVEGKGEECHTPGCVMWMRKPPENGTAIPKEGLEVWWVEGGHEEKSA